MIIAILIAIYVLPAFVAHQRSHRQLLAIVMLDLLVGWTLVGWIVAMVWACTSDVNPDTQPEKHK